MGINETILERIKEQICEEIDKVTHMKDIQYTLLDIITSVGKFLSFETSIEVKVVSNHKKEHDISLELMAYTIEEVKEMALEEAKIKGIQKALAQKILSLEQIAELFEVEPNFVLKIQKGEIK